MAALAPAIRNDSIPSYMGGLHPRLKSPLGHRLAQSYVNLFMGGSGPFTGPTIAGCSVDAVSGTLTVVYNASLLRGESVIVQSFEANISAWGTRDAATFMVCFSATGGDDCLSDDEQHLDLWLPASAEAGTDGITAVLTLPSSPTAGAVLSALRYGWTLSNEGDTCCPELNVTLGYEVCIPGNCPVKSSRTFLPGNPFYANISVLGKCTCLYPQVCDSPNATTVSQATVPATGTATGTRTSTTSSTWALQWEPCSIAGTYSSPSLRLLTGRCPTDGNALAGGEVDRGSHCTVTPRP